MSSLFGIPIYSNPFCYKTESYQYRFPKSKRKRIRKKFARRYVRTRRVEMAFMFDSRYLDLDLGCRMGPRSFESNKGPNYDSIVANNYLRVILTGGRR